MKVYHSKRDKICKAVDPYPQNMITFEIVVMKKKLSVIPVHRGLNIQDGLIEKS